MRIIGRNGSIDVPYENTILYVNYLKTSTKSLYCICAGPMLFSISDVIPDYETAVELLKRIRNKWCEVCRDPKRDEKTYILDVDKLYDQLMKEKGEN